MNKTRTEAAIPRSSALGGVLDGVIGIYLGWWIGGSLGVSIALIGSGAEVLGMPAWAWWYPAICAAALAWFYVLASKTGHAKEIQPFFRNCVGLLAILAAACFLLGAKELGVVQERGGTAGINLGEMVSQVRQLVGWGGLVVSPTIAFVGAGLVVLRLRKSSQPSEK